MKNFILFLASLLFLVSCKKENTSNLNLIRENLKTENLTTSDFVLKRDTVLKGKFGAEIFLPNDLFENYTGGKIRFELKEYYSKEDIILNSLSTITDKDELLESSGMLYLNFTEEGNQLKIKNGKKYKVQLPNKILEKSNIYTNDNDSIFKWKFIEKIERDSIIIDNLKNYYFGITVNKNGDGGFFKYVPIDSVRIIQKQDSLELIKLKREEKIRNTKIAESIFESDFGDEEIDDNFDIINDEKNSEEEKNFKINLRKEFYSKVRDINQFTSSKLGWINCDRVINVVKNAYINFKINDFEKITDLSFYCIYQDYKTFLLRTSKSSNSINIPFKISGKLKIVIVSNSDENFLVDTIYIDKNSKTDFEVNLKETSLDKLKEILVSP